MITLEHVTKVYEDDPSTALQDVSLHVDRGEFVAIVGLSGSGKTTLLNLLMKVISPTAGKIYVAGKDISGIRATQIPFYRRSLGIVFQDYRLIADLSAYENVSQAMLIAGGRKKDVAARVSSVFSLLGITELYNRLPAQMSGGQCQKVCMARALINRPQLMLCDEPTGNLDPEASDEIFRLLQLIHHQGITVVMATHDINRAKEYGARIISLDDLNTNTKEE